MKNESQFSSLAQGRLCKNFSVQSFESCGIQSIPDLYLLEKENGFSIWVELKVEKDNRMSFMPGQPQWLEKHEKNGGLAYVLCLHPGGFDGIVRLYPASKARWLSSVRMDQLAMEGKAIDLAALASGQMASPSLWEEVAQRILSDSRATWDSRNW